MLWDKHLFIQNMTEPLTGSVACVCPYVPELYTCASTTQTAQKVAQKEAYSRPSCTPLTLAGGVWATLTQLCLTQQKSYWRDEQRPAACTELPCSICTGFHQYCLLLLGWKWPDITHLEGLAFAFHPYDPWYQNIKFNKFKESVFSGQIYPLRSLSPGVFVKKRSLWVNWFPFPESLVSFYLSNWVEVCRCGPSDEAGWKWS